MDDNVGWFDFRLKLVYNQTKIARREILMLDSLIYLDTYVLQRDMRVRLPKAILSNMNAEKGKTKFDIYFDSKEKALIFKVHEEEETVLND